MAQSKSFQIVGNWKMHGLRQDSLRRATDLAARANAAQGLGAKLILCPPATMLAAVADAVAGSPIGVGGQDCHTEDQGAFTGDVSAPMLRDIGCTHVIVGHSERRQGHGEADSLVHAKAAAARRASLVPIVCVGETAGERDRGEAEAVVARQLAGLPRQAGQAAVIAYEPVWAIGTGRTATEPDIRAMHAAIRARLGGLSDVKILYGGSVKPDNAAAILRLPGVDGALVGGASLDPESFWKIVLACTT
jgi:triosephosphate isomerase (TIM)